MKKSAKKYKKKETKDIYVRKGGMMSTDYAIVCDVCLVFRHAGQCMGGKNSFGYCSKDEDGRNKVADFMVEHAHCNANGIRIVVSDPYGPDPEFYEDLDDTKGK